MGTPKCFVWESLKAHFQAFHVLFIWIHTQVQVAFQPELLRHRADGYKLGTQIPAGGLGIVPCLFVLERFVAEVCKLVPVRPWTPQLCQRERGTSECHERETQPSLIIPGLIINASKLTPVCKSERHTKASIISGGKNTFDVDLTWTDSCTSR